jgi:tight adherence protein C
MTQDYLILTTSLIAGLSGFFVLRGLQRLATVETTEQRLERLTSGLRPLEDAELEMPFLDRVIKPWLRRQFQAAGRLTPGYNLDKLQSNLVRAGFPFGLSALDFLGVKLLSALAGAVFTSFTMSGAGPLNAISLMAVDGIIGFMAPDFWLGSRIRARQAQIRRTLPDALDMLTICVDAGASLDSAMMTISERWDNAIAEEFGKVVGSIGIGTIRRDALQTMARVVDLPEVTSFVAVLVQADQFGLSIANVLHTQSEQLRQHRWQRAEEEARKVPVKLLFPLVFLILPALFAVTIGPAVPILLETFAGLGR